MSGGSLDTSSNAVTSNHELAESAKNHMADVIATVRSTLSKASASVEAVKKGFEGEAGGAFQAAATAWHDEAGRLNTLLTAIEEQVGQGVAQFRSADSENAGGFSQYTTL